MLYIARVNTKHDWLNCGDVPLDKCNVSRPATSEKLLPASTIATYINKQNGGTTRKFINYVKNVTEQKKYTAGMMPYCMCILQLVAINFHTNCYVSLVHYNLLSITYIICYNSSR